MVLGLSTGAALAQRSTISPSAHEQELLELTNQVRAEHGVGPLRWDPALASAAGRHDRRMLGEPALSHQYPGEEELVARASRAGAHFSMVAENLAVAPTPDDLVSEWMHSPPHRANLLDPRLDAIGISVIAYGGELYATEDFAHVVTNLGPDEIEGQIAALVQALGLAIIQDDDAIRTARATCAMDSGSAGGTRPRFIMRWESSSLDRLPSQLTERASTGRYRTAVIGSCAAMSAPPGFSSYHLAVLLF